MRVGLGPAEDAAEEGRRDMGGEREMAEDGGPVPPLEESVRDLGDELSAF